MTHEFQPLSQLLAGKPISVSDMIRHALSIGSALRRIHANGRCHGALTPELIQVSESGARLLPAKPGALEYLTPYTAPEILRGQPANAGTDIFAYGAVLYEMATGRRAFPAANPQALEEEIMAKGFSPIGHEGLDLVVKRCLAKDPAARWQRMQPVQMELKLLAIGARQYEASAARHPDLEAAVSAELEHQARELADLERAATARINELAQAVTVALDDVQLQFTEVEKCLEASQQRAERFAQSAAEAAESNQREIAALRAGLAGEVHAIEQATKGQAGAIESIKQSIARNEDYVERVVEALGALQDAILPQSGEPEARPLEMAS